MTKFKTNNKPVLWLVIIAFLLNTLVAQAPVQAEPNVPFLPAPGQMIPLTPSFSPPMIRGLKIFKNNPFKFEIVMSQGDSTSQAADDNPLLKQALLKEEANKLVKYFLAALTVPEKDMWVNLSPFENNRIVPKEFGITEMGKELLAQDYLLKQVTASVMYPEGSTGKEFWHKIYQEAYKRFGTTNIPVNTFNKVWIVPGTAVVYENAADNTAVIVDSKLKVMLEEDYMALSHSVKQPQTGVNALGSEIVREIIIPQLTKEVNEGKNFAVLRQVYQSLILAFWYKSKLKQSLITQGYVDRKKTSGVSVADKNVDQEIYSQYLRSYKKGVYNYIKEEVDPTGATTPRKYFSGGVAWGDIGEHAQIISGPDSAMLAARILKHLKMFVLTVGIAAALFAAGSSSASAANNQTINSVGAQIVQNYAAHHQDTGVLTAKANGSATFALIKNAVFKATGRVQLGWGGIQELVKDGVVQIDGNTITSMDQKLSPGDHTVTLDLNGIRNIAASTVVEKVVTAPPAAVVAPSANTEVAHPGIVQAQVHDNLSSNTVGHIFTSQIKPSLEPGTKLTVWDLIAKKKISLTRNGKVLESPDLNKVQEGDVLSFDLTGFNTVAAPPAGIPGVGFDLTGPRTSPVASTLKPGRPLTGRIPMPRPRPIKLTAQAAPASVEELNIPVNATGELGSIRNQKTIIGNKITEGTNAITTHTAEALRIQAQLRKSKAERKTPAEIQAEERSLVEMYHLSVPDLAPVPLPYQKRGEAPPVPSFRSNAVAVAYLDYQLAQLNKLANTKMDRPASSSPVNVQFTPYHWQPLASWQVGQNGIFSVVPDLPGRNLLTLYQIGTGLSQYGSLPVAGQVLGPLFGLQILDDLRNFAVMDKTRGNGVRYDVRVKDPITGLFRTLSPIYGTPIHSFDQQGHPVDETLFNVGPVQTIQATLGQLDRLLGDKGIVGDSSKRFPFEDLGYQLSVSGGAAVTDKRQFFEYNASINTDPDTVYYEVYQIDNAKTRYRKNPQTNGWEDVPASTPFNSHLDFYSARQTGFVLHRDPHTGQVSGVEAFDWPTFVTDEFAKVMTEQQTGRRVVGKPYLGPNGAFMEIKHSIKDLKLERMLAAGVDERGNLILGVLRDPLSADIVRIITNPLELNDLSNLRSRNGGSIKFVPGRPTEAPTGLAAVGQIAQDYIADEFMRVGEEWKGVVHPTTVAEKYKGRQVTGSPLAQAPPAVRSLFSFKSEIYGTSPVLKAIFDESEKYWGMIFFSNGNLPGILHSLDNVRTVESLDESNGVHKLTNGNYVIKGFHKEFASDMLVLLDSHGQAIGFIDPSNKLREKRIHDIEIENARTQIQVQGLSAYGFAIDKDGNIRALTSPTKEFVPAKFIDGAVGQSFGTPRITITGEMMVRVQGGKVVELLESGTKTLEDRQVILKTIADGGFEVEDQRVRNSETHKYGVEVFAKGNALTARQRELGIHSEEELVQLALRGQAVTVPVPGSDKPRWIILREAPPTLLDHSFYEQGAPVKFAQMLLRGTLPAVTASDVRMAQAAPVSVPSHVRTFEELTRNYVLVRFNDNHVEWIPYSHMNDLDKMLGKITEVLQLDAKGATKARMYLNPDSRYSRVELVHTDGTGTVYELATFDPLHPSNPVAETKSSIGADGLLHVVTTDLRTVNAGVRVEDVYRQVANGMPVKVYSDRFLQQERIYFKDGHEYYSVSLDLNPADKNYESGQTVIIDGHPVEHVTGIFDYNNVTDYGYHIGLRSIEKKGWYAAIRLTQFTNGRTNIDQTGFVKLEPGLSYEQIMERVEASQVLNMSDVYSYTADGRFDHRDVSFYNDGHWFHGWTLTVNYIGTSKGDMIDHLRENDVVRTAFDSVFPGLHVDRNTSLVEAIRTTPEGVVTKDYRILGDVLERKVFSIIEEDGVVSKIIVGLGFDNQTGEQVRSYELTPDYQVRALFETVPNNVPLKNLFSPKLVGWYTQFMKEHLNIDNADLWQALARGGVSPDFVPVKLREIPFIVKTDHPTYKVYKSIEPQMRPLIEEYVNADDTDRPAILNRISDLVIKFHVEHNDAHYSTELSRPNYIYLPVSPNDSRNQIVYKEGTEDGQNINSLELWMLEGLQVNGKTIFPPNILPGTIMVDAPTGDLKRTMAFDHQVKMGLKDFQLHVDNMRVNYYSVGHDPSLTQYAFTSLGEIVSESHLYERNRVVNGALGKETRGVETIYYARGPYPFPLYGVLEADTNPDEVGRLTMAELNLNYGAAENKDQLITETAKRDRPTAINNWDIITQTIENSVPVEGSKYQEEILTGYWQSVRDYWWTVIPYLGGLAAAFMTANWIRGIIFRQAKKGAAKETESPQEEQIQKIIDISHIMAPSWNAYGFSDAVKRVALERFRDTVIPMLQRGQSLAEVLQEHFNGYEIWRKQVMGIDEPVTPAIDMEDLWIMTLRDADAGIFSANVPDGLNYLTHKAIEARREAEKDGKIADIGGFVRKEYTRWGHIIELQQATFRGRSGGVMSSVVPYDYSKSVWDINGKFRTRDFVNWYDHLGYTVDRQPDLRDEIYVEFIKELQEKVHALKSAVKDLSTRLGTTDVFRLKKAVTGLPEYKDYVKFISMVENGGWSVPDSVTIQMNGHDVSKDEIDQLIDHKPLIGKTHSQSGASVGRFPLPLRLMKPVAQIIRNSYTQITLPPTITAVVGLFVAAYDGLLTLGTASAVVAAIVAGVYLLKYPLGYLLDRKVNSKAFRKPTPVWAGYDKPQVTSAQKWYRITFWLTSLTAMVSGDIFLLHYFLIPHMEMLGATWYPFGLEYLGNWNAILMTAMWSVSSIFLFFVPFAATYLVKPFFTIIHGAVRGVGIVKTTKDIQKLQRDIPGKDETYLERLIEQKLLPAGLTKEEQFEGRKMFIKFILGQRLYGRDTVSQDEYNIAVNQGRLDHFKSPEVRQDIMQFINSLAMNMPKMPSPDQTPSVSFLVPVYGEGLIHTYEELDTMQDTGYTNLNYMVSRSPQRWENFIQRVRSQGIADADEVERMAGLFHKNGVLGAVNEDLKMQIRLWASYEVQPFVRTLDGLMNTVRAHQIQLRIAYPDMSKEEIRERTNREVQILWAYQIWGDVLNATDKRPDLQAKREDTLFLLKKYYNELGYLVDIASIQKRSDGKYYKVLSRYNPESEQIEDVRTIALTAEDARVIGSTGIEPIAGEGKPANQMHASTFVRSEFLYTIDVNQDLDPEEAWKIPMVLQEFKDKKVAVVNAQEDIQTEKFSLIGWFMSFSDGTFNRDIKRHMEMVSTASHHGHPDVWRVSAIREVGGVSSTTDVSEDYFAGILAWLRGLTIKRVEYIRFKKGREASWGGSVGVQRKFAMGSPQWFLSRVAHWVNQRTGLMEGAGEYYNGPVFFTIHAAVVLGLFAYTLVVMIGGISPFTAIPGPFVTMMAGVLWVGQSVVFPGYARMVSEKGFVKGTFEFLLVLPLMAPFFIAHIFTYAAGAFSGLAGQAKYVVTGRPLGREHVPIDRVADNYAKSHILPGAIGLGLSAYGYHVWKNETFLLSIFTILAFTFPMIVPILANPGNYPIHGVSLRISADLFKDDFKRSFKSMWKVFWTDGLRKGKIRDAVINTVAYGITYTVWFAITFPVQIPGLLLNLLMGKPKYPAPMTTVTPRQNRVEPPPLRETPANDTTTKLSALLKELDNNPDKAMQAGKNRVKNLGGIDLGRTVVSVDDSKGIIQMVSGDPAMLRLLLNSDGLAPIIYNIKTMTPSMVNHFVGLN